MTVRISFSMFLSGPINLRLGIRIMEPARFRAMFRQNSASRDSDWLRLFRLSLPFRVNCSCDGTGLCTAFPLLPTICIYRYQKYRFIFAVTVMLPP